MGLAAGEALARAARRMIVLEQLTFGHDRAHNAFIRAAENKRHRARLRNDRAASRRGCYGATSASVIVSMPASLSARSESRWCLAASALGAV